jgi:hypothetical protein
MWDDMISFIQLINKTGNGGYLIQNSEDGQILARELMKFGEYRAFEITQELIDDQIYPLSEQLKAVK